MSDLKYVIRRPLAAQDLEAQAMFIAEENMDAALRFLDCVEQTVKSIAAFPGTGAPFATSNPRLQSLRMKLVQAFPKHVVFDIEHEESVEIVRILRGGQDMDVELHARSS